MRYLIVIVLNLCGWLVWAEAPVVRVLPYVRIFNVEPISLLTVVDQELVSAPLKKQLSKIKLGGAPQLGEKIEFTNTAIAEAIRNSSIQKNWSIQIPYEIVIENKGYEFDSSSVEKQLLSKWQNSCADCDFKILSIQLPNLAEEHKLKPWTLLVDPKLPRGNFSVQVIVSANEAKKLSYWVNGQLEIYKKVPVLNRSTPMNTRLSEDDFKFETRNITLATDAIPTMREIVGLKAKYTMSAGDIIWSQSLIKEKAVQRGEIVRVSVGDENWDVSIQAQTEQDGYIGDTVNLRNMQTNRIITGRIVDFGKVVLK